jgi:Outer membrane protein beta-barrel domain
MFKIYLSFSLLLVSFMASAQLKKGDVLIGGSAYLSGANTKNQGVDGKSNAGNIFVSAGKMIGATTELGLNLGYGHYSSVVPSNSNGSDSAGLKTNTFSAGLYLRRYKDLGNKFSIFLNGGLLGGYSRSKPVKGSPTNYGDSKVTSIGIGLAPGLAYRVSNHFQAELNFLSLANAGYTHSTVTSSGVTSKTNSFNVGTNLGAGYLQNIGIGFRFIL